jgi:hypothetical protein
MFKRKRKRSEDEVNAHVDELAKHDSDRPLAYEDITGVIDCALERLREATVNQSERLTKAAEAARHSLCPPMKSDA